MAAAKKTTAKKTATKKTATKKPAAPKQKSEDSQQKVIAESIANAIRNGDLDGQLVLIEDAMVARMNSQQQENNVAKIPVKKTEKKVAPPPKKKKSIDLKEGNTYQISDRVKNFGGAKVKFLRYKAETDNQKCIVQMVDSKPGYPKGKKVAVPAVAMEEKKAAPKRRVK